MCWPPSPSPEHGEFPLSPDTRRHLSTREKAQLLYPVEGMSKEDWDSGYVTPSPSHLTADQQRHLIEIRSRRDDVGANELAKYQRRQALKPAALFARLKARVARVSWDSWG